MKTVTFSRILGQSTLRRSFHVALAAPALVFTLAVAQAGTPAAPAAPAAAAPSSNWVGLTIGGAFVNGDDAGMMQRTQTNGDFYGGISGLEYSKDLGNSTTMTLDGHALPGLEDYEANLNVTKADIGYIKLGYKQYRTWYDGSGGYMPQLAGLHTEPVYGDELHLDRGEFSFEAGLRMEKMPEVTFSYTHAFREGNKDSTSWAARQSISATSTTNFLFNPALWNLDESIDTFGLDVEHTLGNTDLGLGLTYEHVSYDNTLYYQSGSVNTSTGANSRTNVSKTDETKMDLFAGNLHSVTRFNDKVWLTAGFAYTTVDTDTDGSTRSISRALGNTTSTPSYYTTPAGGGSVQQYAGNLNVMWTPIPDFTVTPSLRLESSSEHAVTAIDNYNPLTGVRGAGQAYLADVDTTNTTGALDLRYTGIQDVVLYGKGLWGHEDSTKWYQDVYSPVAGQPPVAAGAPSDWLKDDISLDEQQYTLGANWYPAQGLSFSLQGYYAERNQSYNPTGVNGPGGNFTMRPAIIDHDSTVDDINFRVTWRPLGNLSLVTRYDYNENVIDNRGVRWSPTTAGGGPTAGTILKEVQSAEITSNILSESVIWKPLDRLYVQGTFSYTWAQTDTDTLQVPDSDNDYVTFGLTAGYAIDDRTTLTANYSYYGASNYAQQGAPYTPSGNNDIPYAMGYGLNTQEHSASLTLTRMLTENMVWNLSYAFMTSQTDSMPDQSGGFNDFTAQMISTGLQIRF